MWTWGWGIGHGAMGIEDRFFPMLACPIYQVGAIAFYLTLRKL